jgi:hypothetical protein
MKPRKTRTTSKPKPPSPVVVRKASEGRGRKTPGLSADARIAMRAYELYEQRGRQDGHALEDWLQAEREIRRGA